MEFTCLCCGIVYPYDWAHKLEDDGLVCADCFVECEWD